MKEDKPYLLHIKDAINKIEIFTKGIDYRKFIENDMIQSAVIRQIEIIGEASKQLPREIKDKHSEIEWKATTDFRNVIIHEYFGIDLKIMWDIIKNELPPLERKLKRLHRTFKNKSK